MLFLATIVGELALIATFRYPVLEDGPLHLQAAVLLGNFGGIYSRYYVLTNYTAPNLSTEYLLAALVKVFTPNVAEKIMLGGYIVALPLALRYAVNAVRPGRSWLAFLAFPFTFTATLQLGFFGFSYGVVVFLLAVGYAFRHRNEMHPKHTLVLLLLLLLTYTTHLLPFLEAVIFIGTVYCWEMAFDAWEAHKRGSTPRVAIQDHLRRMAPFAIAATPCLILTVAYVLANGTSGSNVLSPGQWRQLVSVFDLSLGILSYSAWEKLPCLALAVLLAILVIAAVRSRLPQLRLRREDAFGAAALVSLVTIVLAPEKIASGGGFSTERLALFPFYALVLWIASQPVVERLSALTVAVAIAVQIVLLAIRLPFYQSFSDQVAEYDSIATSIRPGSTMLQINLWPDGVRDNPHSHPLSNEASRIAAERHGIDLGNAQGWTPYYDFHFRPRLDPYFHLQFHPDGMGSTPPDVDLRGYNSTSGGEVDYVFVLGRRHATPDVLSAPGTVRVLGDLASEYRLVTVTRPTGLVEVYALTRTDLHGSIP